MKNNKLLFGILLLLLTTLLSCSNNNDVEGTYYNIDKENRLIDYIQFKDGYYYNGITGNMMRFKYKVEEDKIIVDSNGMQIVFNFIDSQTIEFGGMKFRKGVDKSIIKEKTTSQLNTSKKKTKIENFDLSKDKYENETAIVKDIINVENEVFIVVDVITVEYKKDMNFEIVNKNTKLRTYKVATNVLIKDIECSEIKTSKYLIDNKEQIISPNLSFVLISTNNNGELTNLNLGCWN